MNRAFAAGPDHSLPPRRLAPVAGPPRALPGLFCV